ncbi:SMP-30/gluconolactonase/LRE family protein [bacterium]|nr:SMP-30/gluconolactonase/LRE family protein [bacterium]
MEPTLIADYACEIGENPLWHPDEKVVYWEDIPKGRLFRYDPATGNHEMCLEHRVIGGFTIQADGALLLFMDRGTVKLWRGGELTTVIDEIPEERDTRFNDVMADPRGRVFCGVMSTADRPGRLYRLDPDHTLSVVAEDVGTSNGMGFTPDLKQIYHTDSHAHEIHLYDYDVETGAISSRRVFASVPDGEGVPDGMTVDAEGQVWGARWGGARLVRYTPDGEIERRIDFPAEKVSSVIFGGEALTDIYVTTAGGPNKDTDGAGAGALFHLNLGIRGVDEFRSRIEV